MCVTTSIILSAEGKQIPGTLQVVSATGGSARMSKPFASGTLGEIFLRTREGEVNAVVEFLPPRRQGQSFGQAFRFLAFGDEDYARFERALQILGTGQRIN